MCAAVSAQFLLLGLLCVDATGVFSSASNRENRGHNKPKDVGIRIATVHVIAHSHDDPGWVETVDQYYRSEVNTLLTNTVQSLMANSTRIFNQVEMIYFRRWYLKQTASLQKSVAKLVQSGQLSFLNGGLCMNDEATTHNGAIIDQMSWGHSFIKEEFGASFLPTVGWQIDSFGHSKGHATLMSAMGLSGVVGQKIDFQDHEKRAASKELEFEWKTVSSRSNTSFLGHILFDNTKGYTFTLPPVIDNPSNPLYNVEEIAALVNDTVFDRISKYLHPNEVLMLYGNDFAYQDAPLPFESMEKVMKYVNNRPEEFGFKLEYSTPARYFAAIRKQTKFPNYDGDFFPTSFSAHYIRSGYYSSRPAQKVLDRKVWARGHAAMKLHALVGHGVVPSLATALAAVEAAVGVHQHHDAMSGTDFAFVAADYARRLSYASTALGPVVSMAAMKLTVGNWSSSSTCDLANISVCPATSALANGKDVLAVVFNPLGHNRSQLLEIPVPIGAVSAFDIATGNPIRSEVQQAALVDSTIRASQPWSIFVFVENLRPLELRAIRLSGSDQKPIYPRKVNPGSPVRLKVGSASIEVDSSSGQLTSIGGHIVKSSLLYYTPNMANSSSHGFQDPNPCSSAYAFRPLPGDAKPISSQAATIYVTEGSLVRQTVAVTKIGSNNTITHINRINIAESSVDTITRIGPLSTDNEYGQEAIIRFATNIDSSRTWYTDANGLQMMCRERRTRNTSSYAVYEPVSQNYYPASATAYISDKEVTLSLALDSAWGVSSLADGVIEAMMHRRQIDHGCRVDEGYEMNDNHTVTRRMKLSVDDSTSASAAYRMNSLSMLHPIEVYFGSDWSERRHTKSLNPLPPNVHLHTLRLLQSDDMRCDPFDLEGCLSGFEHDTKSSVILFRLQHLFDVNEHPTFSQPAVVNPQNILRPQWTLHSMEETTLSVGRPLNIKVNISHIVLLPLQIRTFLCHVA